MTDRRILARRFETERPRLRAIASRLLGSTADAEDAVQETWLRLERTEAAAESVAGTGVAGSALAGSALAGSALAGSGPAGPEAAHAEAGGIENLAAWLTTVVSRVCLDMLRSPRRTRERPWRVEAWPAEPPVAEQWHGESASAFASHSPTAFADPAELVAQSDRVNVALLIVLETLSPAERIAFVLRDVFGQPFDEIAVVLDRSPEAVRQLASRARRRVRGAEEPARPNRERGRRIIEAWLAAANEGNVDALLALLDDGAVLRADYGTTTQIVSGARSIAEQAVLSGRLAAHSTPILIDGEPGVAAVLHGRVVSIMVFGINSDAPDSHIVGLSVLADPRRLEALGVAKALTV